MNIIERKNFGKIQETIEHPNLIEGQIVSFREFLQANIPVNKRKAVGLHGVFSEVFPIESHGGHCRLEYVSYMINPPKLTEMQCIREGVSYASSFYVTLRLCEEQVVKEEEIYMGELPIMTERGSFIINGAERVVISQMHRSPGVCFESSTHTSGKILYNFRVIPDRGTWLETQFDNNDLLYVYLDRRRRRRKFLITTLLRALGYSTDAEILSLFYPVKEMIIEEALQLGDITRYVLVEDVVDAEKGMVIARAFEPLTKTIFLKNISFYFE